MSIFQSQIDPNFQRYATANVYVNGSLLMEEASVSVDRIADSTSIYTLGRGYSGEAAGAKMLEISVDNAVPSTGFEMEPGIFMNNMQEVNFAVTVGDKILQFNGFIISDNFSHAVNTNSKLSFKAKGFFEEFY